MFSPPFVERRTYRQRRLMDAARLLPTFGAVLFAVPMLWFAGTAPDTPGGAAPLPRTAAAGIYLFAVWAGLIVNAAWMARLLARGPGMAPPSDTPPPPVERP